MAILEATTRIDLNDNCKSEDEVAGLLEAFGFEPEVSTDPLQMATEAAVASLHPISVAYRASSSLPSNATDFERGLTYGIALMLASTRTN